MFGIQTAILAQEVQAVLDENLANIGRVRAKIAKGEVLLY